MLKEYDIDKLNPRPNPYAARLKKTITINLDENVINYFKRESDNVGIPYQSLINMYLRDCVTNERHLSWK